MNPVEPVASTRKPRLWLAVVIALAVIGVGVLWPLRGLYKEVCPAIYPAPPGCFAQQPLWVPIVGMVVVLVLLATAVTLYALLPAPRPALIATAIAIVIAVAVCAIVTVAASAGAFDPVQPPVMPMPID